MTNEENINGQVEEQQKETTIKKPSAREEALAEEKRQMARIMKSMNPQIDEETMVLRHFLWIR